MKKRFVIVIICLLVVVTAVGLFLLLRPGMPVQHVIFISMDTTRADHFGCYGNTWIRTPAVDALAGESLLFSNYYTVTPVTLPSHTSLFTGKYPINHGVPANGYMVNKKNRMLAEYLKAEGFDTIGFIGAFPLSKWFDFSQGFDYYDERFEKHTRDENVSRHQRSAQQVTDEVIAYFDQKDIPDHLFLFVHYFDPHNPYEPPLKYKKMYKHDYREYNEVIEGRGPLAKSNGETGNNSETGNNQDTGITAQQKKKARYYAGEISYMDHHIGRLLEYLRARKILDRSVLVLTSDHGENLFWDRNPFSHGWDTNQGVIKAVCIIRTPAAVSKPRKVEQLVSNIDVLPTLLRYLKLPVPGNLDGEAFDLEGGQEGLSAAERYVESSKPTKITNNSRWRNINNARCIISGEYKYILTPYLKAEEFYDLFRDPFECRNLMDSRESDIMAKIKAMKGKLHKWIFSARPMKSKFQDNQKKETIERLRSLGYL